MTGADGHPAPTSDRSRAPLTVKHDDVTVQVPTTLPPQGAPFEHDPPAPPPPEVPPVPGEPPEPALHALAINPNAAAVARTADEIFVIERTTAAELVLCGEIAIRARPLFQSG